MSCLGDCSLFPRSLGERSFPPGPSKVVFETSANSVSPFVGKTVALFYVVGNYAMVMDAVLEEGWTVLQMRV